MSGSQFVINISFDASADSAPTGFKPAVLAAAQEMESLFTNNVTLDISVGFGEVQDAPVAGGADRGILSCEKKG